MIRSGILVSDDLCREVMAAFKSAHAKMLEIEMSDYASFCEDEASVGFCNKRLTSGIGMLLGVVSELKVSVCLLQDELDILRKRVDVGSKPE